MEERDALVRIGRNLANFQTLEHLLRELIPTLSMHGTVTQMQAALRESQRKVRKASLGDLSTTFQSSVFGEPPTQDPPEELTEPHFSFSMRIEAAPERIKDAKKKWRKLVVERNRLVHTQLMQYDLSKAEDRVRLCDALDKQNIEICSVLDELALLRNHKASAAAAMAEQLQNGKLFTEGSPDDA